MTLCAEHLVQERPTLLKNDVRLRRIGRDDNMPEHVLDEIARTEEATAHCTRDDARPGDQLRLESGTHGRVPKPVRGREEWNPRTGFDQLRRIWPSRLYTAGPPRPGSSDQDRGANAASRTTCSGRFRTRKFTFRTSTGRTSMRAASIRAIDDYASRTRRFGGCAREARLDPEKRCPGMLEKRLSE